MLVDIFRAVPREVRRENLAAYQTFLVDRDGVMDLEKRQLSRREERMGRYERPLSRIREIDRELFADALRLLRLQRRRCRRSCCSSSRS